MIDGGSTAIGHIRALASAVITSCFTAARPCPSDQTSGYVHPINLSPRTADARYWNPLHFDFDGRELRHALRVRQSRRQIATARSVGALGNCQAAANWAHARQPPPLAGLASHACTLEIIEAAQEIVRIDQREHPQVVRSWMGSTPGVVRQKRGGCPMTRKAAIRPEKRYRLATFSTSPAKSGAVLFGGGGSGAKASVVRCPARSRHPPPLCRDPQ